MSLKEASAERKAQNTKKKAKKRPTKKEVIKDAHNLDAPENKELLEPKGKQGHNLNGRPKGVKNKTTLFKEAMREGFEAALEKDAMRVFKATVQCAIGEPSKDNKGKLIKDENGDQMYLNGSDSAKKMILDRVVPTSKATDFNAADTSGNKGITIHIEKLIADTGKVDEVLIEDGVIVDED